MRQGILILTFLLPFIIQAQTPLHEMRGVWMTTVHNIDWPSEPGLDASTQQEEFNDWLQLFDSLHLNSVFVQVRPSGDVLYPSELEPWSRFLTGTTGRPPSPFYDPLEFMTKACHEQGMEFHAWLNPYRVYHTPVHDSLSAIQPEWIIHYGNKKILNPGLPEVVDHITAVVAELVVNYNVDGIHFDDYFYPYPQAGATIDDASAYQQYADSNQTLEDWRRENVNQLIKRVSDTIRALDHEVKFGVSPFGIWRNKVDDISGSSTRGLSGFDAIYADSRKWIEEKWVDYLAPQLYWSREDPIASFDTLAAWWNELAPERNLYAGLALYKVDNNDDPAWGQPEEIIEQIHHIRDKKQFGGVIFFSASKLRANKLNILESLKQTFSSPALGARHPWHEERPRSASGVWSLPAAEGVMVHWKRKPGRNPRFWAVYRLGIGEQVADRAEQLIKIVSGEHTSLHDPEGGPEEVYAVKAVNAFHFESQGVYTPREMMVDAQVASLTLRGGDAVLTRFWEDALPAGEYTLHLKGISANADLHQLRFDESRTVEVAAYEHHVYMDSTILIKRQQMEDSLARAENQLSVYLDSIEVLHQMDELLSSGFTNASTGTAGDNTAKMDELIRYYQKRFLDMHRRERRYKQHADSLRQRRNTLHYRLNNLKQEKKLTKQDIYVALKVHSSGKQHIAFRYPVSGVDYRVSRALDVRDTTVHMRPTATVQQITDVDWRNISVYLRDDVAPNDSSTAGQYTNATITSGKQYKSFRFPEEKQTLHNAFKLYSDSLSQAIRHVSFNVPGHWRSGQWNMSLHGQPLPSTDKKSLQEGKVSFSTGADPLVHLVNKKDSLVQKKRYIYNRQIRITTFEVANNYPFDVKVILHTPSTGKNKTAVMSSAVRHNKKSENIAWYWNVKARESEKLRVISDKRHWFWQSSY